MRRASSRRSSACSAAASCSSAASSQLGEPLLGLGDDPPPPTTGAWSASRPSSASCARRSRRCGRSSRRCATSSAPDGARYHAVSAPPGDAVYYLNVMAGPTRDWIFADDPDHEWTVEPQARRPAEPPATERVWNEPCPPQRPDFSTTTSPAPGRPRARRPTRSTSPTPPTARCSHASRCRAPRTSTPPCAPRARRCRHGAPFSTIARARKLFELRERLVARHEDLARSVTVEMGKTIADARAEVARMIEMVECAVRGPDDDAGARARGRLAQHRRRDDPPARRRVRRDRPLQLPGDGAVLVPPLRDRVRQHVHPQAERAGPARRSRSRSRSSTRWGSRPGSSTSSTAVARSSRGSSSTPASTPSPSSAPRRSPSSSTSAPPRPASASRRSAAPRTTWS